MIYKHGIYKHVNNTDVALKILRVVKLDKGLKVKGSWINIVNPNNIYSIGLTEEFLIEKEQIKNWKRYYV